MRAKRCLIFVLALAAATACRPDDQRTNAMDPLDALHERTDLPLPVRAQLDSGNQAYREEHYEAALSHYRRAVELDPNAGPAWFGIYMAYDATGQDEAAEDALKRAMALIPDATLLRPSPHDTLR